MATHAAPGVSLPVSRKRKAHELDEALAKHTPLASPDSARSEDGTHAPFGCGAARAVRPCSAEPDSQCSTDSYIELPGSSSSACSECEAGSRQPQYSPTYIKNTKMPVDGWFQACRGCGSWTASCLAVSSKEVPMCRRCKLSYTKATAGEMPKDASPEDHAFDPLVLWMPQFASRLGTRKLTPKERSQICSSALLQLEAAWERFTGGTC